MSNKEVNDIVISVEERNQINHQFDFCIKQLQDIQNNFNSDNPSHFADTVCALPNMDYLYELLDKKLDDWYNFQAKLKEKK